MYVCPNEKTGLVGKGNPAHCCQPKVFILLNYFLQVAVHNVGEGVVTLHEHGKYRCLTPPCNHVTNSNQLF